MGKISLMLVDDHEVVREGLRALLRGRTDITVVGEAEDGRQAIVLAQEIKPQVVLMDVAMPDLNGYWATKEILKHVPSAKVLVLSSYDDDECVTRMLKVGAAGFLTKQTVADELITAIHTVKRGQIYVAAAIARRLDEQTKPFISRQCFKTRRELTKREVEVLQLIADGLTNRMAADTLGVSPKTIEKHRQGIMDKLNIHETAGLTRYALARGLVDIQQPSAR